MNNVEINYIHVQQKQVVDVKRVVQIVLIKKVQHNVILIKIKQKNVFGMELDVLIRYVVMH